MTEVKNTVISPSQCRPLWQVWWHAARPATLGASVGPVLLANGLAYHQSSWQVWVGVITLICALSLQILVNLANDLADGLAGVDSAARLGPARMLASGLLTPIQLKTGMYLTLVVALITGLCLVWHGGVVYALLGVAALVGALAYSGGPVPLANRGLGEVMVLVYFGWLAVVGSFHLQAMWPLDKLWPVLGYGTVVGLLSAAMMLVNNLRDRQSDRRAGKYTLAVRLGRRGSIGAYRLMLAGALCLHVCLTLNTSVPVLIEDSVFTRALVCALPLLVCLPATVELCSRIGKQTGRELNRLLADNGKLCLLYCVSMALAAVWI